MASTAGSAKPHGYSPFTGPNQMSVSTTVNSERTVLDLSQAPVGSVVGRTAAGIGVLTDKLSQNTPIVLPPGTSTTAPLKFTAQSVPLSVPVQGTFELVGNTLQFTQLARRRGIVMSSNVITSTVTLANSTVETAPIITSGHGAAYLEVGKAEHIELYGTVGQTTTGGGQLIVRVKYNGTTLLTMQSTAGNITANTPIKIDVMTTCRSIGTTGTMQINARLDLDNVTNVPDGQILATINTTVAQPTEITLDWSVANVANTVSIHQGYVLSIEPDR